MSLEGVFDEDDDVDDGDDDCDDDVDDDPLFLCKVSLPSTFSFDNLHCGGLL